MIKLFNSEFSYGPITQVLLKKKKKMALSALNIQSVFTQSNLNAQIANEEFSGMLLTAFKFHNLQELTL